MSLNLAVLPGDRGRGDLSIQRSEMGSGGQGREDRLQGRGGAQPFDNCLSYREQLTHLPR